jgi:diguanylate cyclase (GGDEF)-like protein
MLLKTKISRAVSLATSTDGSLLDETTWKRRHRRIALYGWTLAVVGLGFAIADHEGPAQFVLPVVMLAAMGIATSARFGRRTRELAVATTFIAGQLYLSRYVGNMSGIGSINVIVLSFYQDVAPIAVVCVAAICLVIVAAIDPGVFASNVGFGKEQPLSGMALRATAIILAGGLTFAVWRAGTQAAQDQLTGMLSRTGAEHLLGHEIRHGHRPTAWVCDIDNFREVNRRLGAATGDLLLKHVARQLRGAAATLPGAAVSARLEGDTFLLASPDCPDGPFVEAFAQGLELAAGSPLTGVASHDIRVRLSVGAATWAPGESARDLIHAAVQNMRRAKGLGVQRVVVERPADADAQPGSSLLSAELYRACDRDELELYFQPIVSLADERPVGAEALVRWNHPERGLVYPGAFLPEAEGDSALMAAVSRTLARQFLRVASTLIDRHGPDWLPYGYSFNIAAIRLRDPRLITFMGDLLARTGIERSVRLLALEVTEGALMEIEDQVPEILSGLSAAGYQIVLDDFGTGHSSLAHLRDFPLDTVKIDKSFVRAIDRSPTDRAVVKAVADIARAAGLSAVAEGIEEPFQRSALLSIKPDMLGQGWLFAKALPVDQFEAWVLERRPTALSRAD